MRSDFESYTVQFTTITFASDICFYIFDKETIFTKCTPMFHIENLTSTLQLTTK